MFFTKTHIILILGIALLSNVLKAQDNLTIYWQPQISLNYKVSKNYSHNFAIANRSYLYQEEDFVFNVRQYDISHFSNLKIRDNQSVGLGVQYRIREIFEDDKSNELRFTQQYNITQKYRSLRLGNRFRAEQRLLTSQTIHRFRYRLALDLPLQGVQLDIGEPYFIISSESLLSTTKASKPEYDQRITAHLGWLLSEKTKLQVGSEYRFENYTQKTENVLFILTSLIVSL
ncbi:DUF2490 domain-containing protein [Maribacter aestuarii]|uniref:DUF2490 domain-containing protein n=1 Tax=Maribacter aestuarii TaxID=1130723 RepID=UPI00248C02AE|nr:DUF2490 domain-containing protein [Maribacter aestuarii]